MTAYIFQQLAKLGAAKGVDDSVRQKDTRAWFRAAAAAITTVNQNKMMQDKKNVKSSVDIKDVGKMFMFFYDPKLKKTLPYYDKFPLIFIIEFYDDGFLGINLHYLPMVLRAKLMDALYSTSTDSKFNDKTKLKISYGILNSAARFREFKPCVKRYLSGHIRSEFLYIKPNQWDAALMLPTERFAKATKEQVHRESRKMIK